MCPWPPGALPLRWISFGMGSLRHSKRHGGQRAQELQDLRRKLENLNLRIKTQLEELLRKRKEYFSDSFISNRDGHFTLPVKKEYKFRCPA